MAADNVADSREKLIERELPVPLSRFNELSAREIAWRGAGGIRTPKIYSLHVWFARRPPGPSRILTLSAVLPAGADPQQVAAAAGLGGERDKTIYELRPRRLQVEALVARHLGRRPGDVLVVDPMAGGGSIPLESLRLGFRTVAIDYNPVAYLVLKATLEFPAKYADSGLFEETLRAAKELLARAGDELGRYYGADGESYVFARGVRCPHCGSLIPVQGVAPTLVRGPRGARYRGRYLKITFDKDRKAFTVETSDEEPKGSPIEKRRTYITCPYCGYTFQLRGRLEGGGLTPFHEWFARHADLMRRVVEQLEPASGLEGDLLELHVPLVKRTRDSFVAIWDDEDEKGRFVQALRDLSRDILDLQDYIPLDEIPAANEWAATARRMGITNWYMLFNPRQLLAVAKLSKLVAETAERLASKDGEFGAAVALYLALAVDKVADYNNIATAWDSSQGSIKNLMRGESTIDFRLEYGEMVVPLPSLGLGWALEADVAESGELSKTAGGVLPVLRFLADEFCGAGLRDRVRVYMADAAELSKVLGEGVADVIHVDPPYFDQVIYSDRSEFFWAILRRSLRPVLELLFRPGLRLSGWSWTSPEVPRDREVVSRGESKKFEELFGEFVREAYRALRDDGVLVMWFTHPTDEAWRAVGRALYGAGFVVTRVWPLRSEMRTRYKGLVNEAAQMTSLAIVARKGERMELAEVGADIRRSLAASEAFREAARRVVEEARQAAGEAGASPTDVAALLFGSALAAATQFEVRGARFDDLFDAATTVVADLFVEPLVLVILTKSGPVQVAEEEAREVSYYLTRAMLSDAMARSYLTLWLFSRVDLKSGGRRDEPLLLSYDFAQTVAKLLGSSIDNLKDKGLVEEVAKKGEGEGGEEKGVGKGLYPSLFKVLTAAGGARTVGELLTTLPGKSIFLAYLALRESGTPSMRAEKIRKHERAALWSDEEVAEAASLAVVLLETAHSKDLGLEPAQGESPSKLLEGSSELKLRLQNAIMTLLCLLPRLQRGCES